MDKISQIRHEYDNQIRELKEKYEREDFDKSTSSGFSSDLGQKLKDQVNLTKELVTRLITDSIRMNEKLMVEFNYKKN